MADNVQFQSTQLATPASGTTVSTDEAASGHIQRVKIAYSADGVDTHVPAGEEGLLVQASGIELDSTSQTLTGGATFTGAWHDLLNYSIVNISAYADVASASGGWKLQWSGDGTNVDKEESLTLAAASGRSLALNTRARYFRTVYTNGASAQATFRLHAIAHTSGSGANNYTLNTGLTQTSLATLTRSVIVGESSSGGGTFHNVKVTPSGALTTEIDDGGGSITVDGTVAATQSGTWNLNNIGGTISLPTGAATEASLATVAGAVSSSNMRIVESGLSLPISSSAAETYSIDDQATNATLLDANASRKGFAIYNDSTSALYIKFGSTASTTSFSVKVEAYGYYEMFGHGLYTGQVDGIHATNSTGSTRVSEW